MLLFYPCVNELINFPLTHQENIYPSMELFITQSMKSHLANFPTSKPDHSLICMLSYLKYCNDHTAL